MDMKRFFLYAIVIAALALAGCGGSGNGGGGMTVTTDPDPMPMDLDLSALTAGMMLGNAMTYTIPPGESRDSGDVRFTCPSGGSACMVTVTADGATYDGNGGTPTVANSQAAIDKVNNAATAAAMAAKIAPAIADPDGDGEFPEAGDLRGNVGGDGNDEASRPGAAATFVVAAGGAVTVDVDGSGTDESPDRLDMNDMTAADPPASIPNQFQKQTAAPPMLDGFTGSVHERTVDKVTDTLTVYTNVEAPGDEEYSEYYQTSSADARDGITSIADGVTVGEGDAAYDTNVLTFEADVSAISAKISATDFSIGNGLSKEFTDSSETEARMFEGSFNGIPGTYVCTVSCTITTNNDGEVSTFGGAWTFTPTEAGAEMMVQGVIPDADFLTFGYWLQATEGDDGEMTYGIRTFATGADTFVPPGALEGQATYAGKATGMYVKKTFDDRGLDTATSSGQFTAVANLTATFNQTTAVHPDGVGSIAPSLVNSITGTVSTFKDASSESSIDDAWSITLNKATINSEGAITGGTTTGEGSWVAQLYGPQVSNDPDTTDVNEETIGYPTSVAGEFNGHFSNGHVIGAFGATKTKTGE